MTSRLKRPAALGGRAWRFREIVAFCGHFNHAGDTIGELDFALPANVESCDQLKAFLAYYLRDAITEDRPLWMIEGEIVRDLLPWERERAAYRQRDHCTINREWLKLALRELTAMLTSSAPPERVVFAFDGNVMTIDARQRIVVQGSGDPWHSTYAIAAADLHELPARFMRDTVAIDVWKGLFAIGNRRYRVIDPQP